MQNPADTHINACAVLSQLGRHQTALEHAQSALILLQEELLSPPGVVGAAPPQADRIAVLAIAYHNLGVEQEFLKRFEQSVISYSKGVEVAERYLGPKHAVCVTLKNSLAAAKKSAAAAAYKHMLKNGTSTKQQHVLPSTQQQGQGPGQGQGQGQALVKKSRGGATTRERTASPTTRERDAEDDEVRVGLPPIKAPSPSRKHK